MGVGGGLLGRGGRGGTLLRASVWASVCVRKRAQTGMRAGARKHLCSRAGRSSERSRDRCRRDGRLLMHSQLWIYTGRSACRLLFRPCGSAKCGAAAPAETQQAVGWVSAARCARRAQARDAGRPCGRRCRRLRRSTRRGRGTCRRRRQRRTWSGSATRRRRCRADGRSSGPPPLPSPPPPSPPPTLLSPPLPSPPLPSPPVPSPPLFSYSPP